MEPHGPATCFRATGALAPLMARLRIHGSPGKPCVQTRDKPDEALSQCGKPRRGSDLVKIWVDDMRVRSSQDNPKFIKAVSTKHIQMFCWSPAHVYYPIDDAKQLVGDGVVSSRMGCADKRWDTDFTRRSGTGGGVYVSHSRPRLVFYIYAEHPEWLQQVLSPHLQPLLPRNCHDAAWPSEGLAGHQCVAAAKQPLATNMKNVKALFDAGRELACNAIQARPRCA